MKRVERSDWGWVRRGRVGRAAGALMRWSLRRDPQPERNFVGRWGEWLALKHVRGLGWEVVARNWTSRRGEVDLIAYDGDTLVFVEVKTRRQGPASPPPEESIDRRKLRQMEDLAYEFLARCELSNQAVRLDVIAVETPDLANFELRHSENVDDWFTSP